MQLKKKKKKQLVSLKTRATKIKSLKLPTALLLMRVEVEQLSGGGNVWRMEEFGSCLDGGGVQRGQGHKRNDFICDVAQAGNSQSLFCCS